MSSHSMSGMSGMSGMDGTSTACSMNMLGNWQTINTCVLTSTWHIKTEAQFAGTCIGVFLIVFTIETVRRWSREFDRWILESAAVERRETRRKNQQLKTEMAARLADAHTGLSIADSHSRLAHLDHIFFGTPIASGNCRQRALSSMRFRPKMWQQLLRSLLYGVQFTGAVSTSFSSISHQIFVLTMSCLCQQYLVMLIAMTFNGFIIIAIVLGGIFGHFFSTWDTMGSSHMVDFDDLDHGYSNETELTSSSAAAASRPRSCCDKPDKAESGSVSSGSDEQSTTKRLVVTLPEHGYGSGACCV